MGCSPRPRGPLLGLDLGLVWFAEWPDAWTALGAALIVGSTAYIAHREAVRRRRIPRPEPVA